MAKKLNVAYVLEGSVRKSGSQLRITAQLIKAGDGYHLWSETYNRSMNNIFAIQDEISAAVVEALKIELLGEAPKAAVVDPEAYALVLKARYLYAKWGKENFAAAEQAYKQALAIDPDYAEAWAGLSVTYLSQTQSGYLEGEEGLVLARAAVDRAVQLDPKLASAWARRSLIQATFEWDWAAFLIATIYVWNEDIDSAFMWLDRAYRQRDGWITTILNEPLFKGLHDDPRWAEQLDRLNLPH